MQLPGASTAEGTGAPALTGGRAPHALSGSWAAVRWEYARADGSRRVDVVTDLDGAVTLSISDADYVLSHAPRGDGARGTAGSVRIASDAWADFVPRAGDPVRVEYRRSSGTLVLRCDGASWDFGAGVEAAAFTAVLVRL